MNLKEIIDNVLNEEEDSLSGKLPYSINVYGKEGKIHIYIIKLME